MANEFLSRTVNPDGLHLKYIVTKADGSSVDPDAQYFVLRLDPKAKHREAAIVAIMAYADAIEDDLPSLAAELRQMYEPSQDTVPTAGALK